MKYFVEFLSGTRDVQKEIVNPQHIRDAHIGETIILNTFFPEIFDTKTYFQIRDIEIEAGKRLYKLTKQYGIKQTRIKDKDE